MAPQVGFEPTTLRLTAEGSFTKQREVVMAKRTIKKKRKVKPIKARRVTVRQRFDGLRKKVGRDLEPEHPAFFDSHSSIPHRLELDSLQRDIVAVMRRARIPPELIYAYLRTGLIVAEENYEHLSSEDRHDWDRAIMEYLQHAKRRKPMS
jgi:hypothetical protein